MAATRMRWWTAARTYPGALYAQEPEAVFEVLSKSTGWIDQKPMAG
jgi:hypothetical protein